MGVHDNGQGTEIVPFATPYLQQVASIWARGWVDGHADVVPEALKRLRSREDFSPRVVRHAATTRVAVKDGVVLGFCMLKSDELYQMYVSGAARGLGVAQSLMQDAEHRLKQAGHTRAWLSCAVGNDRAARFYEKSGWRNAGGAAAVLETSAGPFSLDVWRFEKILD